MSTDALTIAQTIQAQLGRMALFMMGAHNQVAVSKGLEHEGQGLRFKIKGSKACNWIEVLLQDDDTYTVVFTKGRGLKFKTAAAVEGVYADSLKRVIEANTGLYLKL